MRGNQATKLGGNGPVTRWTLVGAAAAMAALITARPADALSKVQRKAGAIAGSIEQFDVKKGEVSVGAGSTAYVATESPGTGITFDGRYDYPLLKITDFEGSVTTGVSQSVDNTSATMPLLLEGALKFNTNRPGRINAFAGAGAGYGAFFGTTSLQDGATMTMPLALGMEYVTKNKKFAYEPRFTYRPVFGDDLGGDGGQADSWTAVLDVAIPI